MVQEFFGKFNSFKRNARVIKAHAPKLFAGIAITLITTTSIVGSNFNPLKTEAAAMNAQNSDAVVVCVYKGFLNRAPDTAGRKYWNQYYVNSNYDAVKLGKNFYASKEGQKFENIIGFDQFIQRTYRSCLNRSASAAEVKTWGSHHLQGMSRAEIFGFIVVAGDKPWLFPSEKNCAYLKGGSVMPRCEAATAGNTKDGFVVHIPESNIYVNKAWAQNIINLRFAAAQSRFYLEAYDDPSVVKTLSQNISTQYIPGLGNVKKVSPGSHRSFADQTYLYNRYRSNPSVYAPAAVPGTSMHEWGLAIDLRCNGVPLNGDSSCLRWMRDNARKYGVYNLPGEPWHWSSNGR
jgi:hypothetical protein